jgi:hypothetical protein
MYCSKTGTTCKYEECPLYVRELEDCLDALKLKQDLNMLTQPEKLALTQIRTNGRLVAHSTDFNKN